MKKIMILTGVVFGFFVLASAPAFCEEPEGQEGAKAAELREEVEPAAYEDASNFEPMSAELDSRPGERAPEAMPEDESPELAGVGID